MVQTLLAQPAIRLMSFSRAEAYARKYSWFTYLTLPRGVVDLALDRPPQDVDLIAVADSAAPDHQPVNVIFCSALCCPMLKPGRRIHSPVR